MATWMFLGGTGLALMAILVSVDGGYFSILPGYVVMGIGMGLAMTPSTEAITSSLSRERQGVASALNDVAREFGSALGISPERTKPTPTRRLCSGPHKIRLSTAGSNPCGQGSS
jgi:hypothetical protein